MVRKLILAVTGLLLPTLLTAQAPAAGSREKLLMDFGWRFALGHATGAKKDFGYGTSMFFFAKTGYGDGPASGGSHGFKAIGCNFPQNSVGWYRKTFAIPASDLGRRISIQFDGVFRDSVLWINGDYLSNEHSGYSTFRYDLTDLLNYAAPSALRPAVPEN
jgi:beta-galactosidase